MYVRIMSRKDQIEKTKYDIKRFLTRPLLGIRYSKDRKERLRRFGIKRWIRNVKTTKK